jgi:methyl-accepting chemotaxis protein
MSDSESSTNQFSSGRNQRDLNNILVKPRQQLRYAFVFFGGGLGIITIYIVFFLYYLASTIEELSIAYAVSPEVTASLGRAIFIASVATIIFSAVLAIVMFLAGIALSHRIFGPIVPIKRTLEAIRDGNYSARGSLRKRDEFQDVMDLINDVAANLEKRHGSK